MRVLPFVLSIAFVAACAKSEPAPAPVEATPEPVAPAPIDLAAVAGTWNVNVMGATSDSVLTSYTMVATADTAGWTITFPKQKPMAMQISVSGDSIMAFVPEYESVLRKGQKVSTNSVIHLVGGELVGNVVAHYSKGPDSVATLRSKGVRAPK